MLYLFWIIMLSIFLDNLKIKNAQFILNKFKKNKDYITIIDH